MSVALRQDPSKAALPAVVAQVPGTARRPDGFAHDRAIGQVPIEIAFLAAYGVPPGLLLKAAARAKEVDVTADRALLGAGFPEDTFYRFLARHLGMPYLDEPMRLVLPPRDGLGQFEPQALLLAQNARGLDRVLAPQGTQLRRVIELFQAGQGREARSAVVSPRCLKALVRRQTRPVLLHLATHGLGSWDAALSAEGGPNIGQKLAAIVMAAGLLAGLAFAPATSLVVLALILGSIFLVAVLLRLAATASSVIPPAPEHRRMPDHALPIYTIVVPLLREARVVPRLVASLSAIDYPGAKLDIKLMVEEGDHATIAAIEALCLPASFETIVAPRGVPRTKPRALNMGLAYARGEFLVVYDAEDRPDPDQLRAALAMFRARPWRTACLQARLAVDHAAESWLTRLFALEYMGLFDVLMPGLAALRLPIPLGGTSNHFRAEVLRRVNGWDSFNVTEDIDLGFRLARFGFRVEALASTTFEEAPLTLDRWMPQRTRWLKGWMVTLMVLTRQPLRLVRELGFWGSVSVSAALLGTILACLFGPALFTVAICEGLSGRWLHPATPVEALADAASCFLMVAGLASALWPIGLGLTRRRRFDLAPWLVTLPAYLCLVSVAAWKALHEAVVAPQRWNKTEHGLARRRDDEPARRGFVPGLGAVPAE